MSTPGTGAVSNAVISTKLDALTDEVRELRRELVRRDVYDAQRGADQARIATLEERLADQASLRRQVGLAAVSAVVAVIVAIVGAIFG